MARLTAKCPILSNSPMRNYAALAKAVKTSVAPSATKPESQVLSNKVTVAAQDNNSPISQVSIVFRAGPRDETYDTQGISHLLRMAAGLTTSRSTTFGITRNVQQLGANLTCTADRETITYTLQATRDNIEKGLYFLEDAATRQVFKPWELSDMTPRVRYELSILSENVRLLELLHKAAFHTGLGYSLYSPKRQLDKISSETLQHFVNTHYIPSRCAVVGTGMSLSEVASFATSLNLPSGNATASTASKYYGGEIRKERNSSLASVAIAVEGSGFDKEKEALAFAVLQQAAGMGPHVRWGNSVAPLQRSVCSAAGSDPFAVTAFNAAYSDAGLFGVVLQAPAKSAGAITKAAYKWMKNPNITDADVARAKTELKSFILCSEDTMAGQLENLTHNALFNSRAMSFAEIVAKVDSVTSSDVKKAAEKMGSKASMAAIGNLSTVPYLDQMH